ncbi:tRNA lysidine(34) synthetase TilS [TM7 phylum sp. oral taxon 346]|nr:tRNA lysidine(34) synthetase TilS [TM7 phylum sp. oral taxon 356]TWP19471.1 tRNA lysidine(34) synthetase TilS [TM7 phylum sp. oral taxon 348]TWP25635.1 tRNA lysidine(34) synthetase TilS [TM7 phylum sp. oral taxon 346]TWP26529.1 tRNA lysidine(34) synthetase TilS [TM7 phylum sp. oral taxon 348]
MTKYLLAVSGGVDSMVLLDMVATNYHGFREKYLSGAQFPADFVVAHYDHGIRGKVSAEDAEFVRQQCRNYGVTVQCGCGKLTAATGEAVARQCRYDFFRRVAEAIARDDEPVYLVTAHHRDDLLETIALNIVRGTGWRGLAPMNQPRVLRPLLDIAKAELVSYAIEHGLTWREDQTNDSPRYLRNRLRALLASRSPADKAKLTRLYERQKHLRRQIEQELEHYCARHSTRDKQGRLVLRRYDLIMLPADVAIEILRRLTKGWLTRPQLGQLLLFIKVGKPSKQLSWKRLNVRLDVRRVYFYPEM